jgi:hypothetical protein
MWMLGFVEFASYAGDIVDAPLVPARRKARKKAVST